MPNPTSILNGQGLALDLVTNSAAAPGLKHGVDAGAIAGADSPGIVQSVFPLAVAAGAVAQVAAATATAAMAAVSAKKNFLAGFEIGGLGATGATVVEATIVGLAIGTLRFKVTVPAGVTVAIATVSRAYPIPLAASAVNTAITLSVPTFGTGNTDAFVAIWGHTSA